MPQKIVATLQENYNGWTIDEDGEYSEDASTTIGYTLVDITVDKTTEDGFVYELEEEKCMAALREHYGPDAEITIEVDACST